MKSWAKFLHFHSRKCIWKCRLGNDRSIFSASMCWKWTYQKCIKSRQIFLYEYIIRFPEQLNDLRNMMATCMGLLPDALNWGLRMRRECRKRFPRHRLQRKPLVSDPDIHHGTCVMHVPWCMSGPPAQGGGKTFPAFPAHAQPHNFTYRAKKETHGTHQDFRCPRESLQPGHFRQSVTHHRRVVSVW